VTRGSGGVPQGTAPLAAIVADLPLFVGQDGGGWRPWSKLAEDGPARSEALGKEAEFNGLDARGQAAYLIGTMAYSITTLLVALRAAGVDIGEITPGNLFYRHELVHWEEGGAAGEYNRMVFRLPDTLAAGGPPIETEALRTQIVALLEPALLRISAETGLAKAALWRQAADNVASGFLYTGRPLGFESQAIMEGATLLRVPASPLTNKQTGFIEITASDPVSGATLSETFRARGGCCRAYTTGDGGYCSTCVLVPVAERDAKLRNSLLQRLLDEAS